MEILVCDTRTRMQGYTDMSCSATSSSFCEKA